MSKKKKNKLNIRKLFLKEFTKAILLNLQKDIPELLLDSKSIFDRKMHPLIPITRGPNKEQSLRLGLLPSKKLPPYSQGPRNNNPIYQGPAIPILPPGQAIIKLRQLLSNPRILSIECPGPQRPIILNYSGRIQQTPVALSQDDMNNILREVSNITKIPVIPGIFKALFGQFKISASISETDTLGFQLQKRGPNPI
jgi:hypothetical protein